MTYGVMIMLEEVDYGSKKNHKKDMAIIILAYIIVMFIVPFILNKLGIIRVFPTGRAWKAEGNINLAFLFLTATEFLVAFLVGLITHKGNVYQVLILCSFLVKFALYCFVSIILFWFYRTLISNFNILLVRLIVSFYAYKGIFFASTLLCIPTLLGVQLSKVIKNKKKEKEIMVKLNENRY